MMGEKDDSRIQRWWIISHMLMKQHSRYRPDEEKLKSVDGIFGSILR